jgi:hypothetical protein
VDIERLRQSLKNCRGCAASRSAANSRPAGGAVEEHRALARWNGSAPVNMQGEVFSAYTEQILPDFIGQKDDS